MIHGRLSSLVESKKWREKQNIGKKTHHNPHTKKLGLVFSVVTVIVIGVILRTGENKYVRYVDAGFVQGLPVVERYVLGE